MRTAPSPDTADAPPAGTRALHDWDGHARTFNRKVVVHLLARGLSLDDAEDVAQKTWERLLSLDRAGRLPFVSMPGLALQQARFLAASFVRGKKDHDDAALDVVVDERPDAERTTLARDRIARGLAELERLSPSARAVFRRVLEDPPPAHAEVALALGLSEQRVKQIVCETRARLRRALDDTDRTGRKETP